MEFAMLGRNAIHIKPNSHLDENSSGRRWRSVLSATNMKDAARRIKMAGIANFNKKEVFIVVLFLS
jgi:hypothetical protein